MVLATSRPPRGGHASGPVDGAVVERVQTGEDAQQLYHRAGGEVFRYDCGLRNETPHCL